MIKIQHFIIICFKCRKRYLNCEGDKLLITINTITATDVLSPNRAQILIVSHSNTCIYACTPLCKSNGTFSLGIYINGIVSVYQKYKNVDLKCYMLTYYCINMVCVSILII